MQAWLPTLLWILQWILAIKLFTAVIPHGVRHSKPTVQDAIERFGPAAPILLRLSAVAMLIGAIGVVGPAYFGLWPGATSAAAGWIALLMLVSIPYHLRSRSTPNVFVSIILAGIALVVAYGRWVWVPI